MIGKHQPSLLRIIQIDYPAFLAFVFPIVFFGVFLFIFLTEGRVEIVFVYVVAAITLFSLLFFLWRYNFFLSLYNEGIEAQATVNGIGFFRGRGKVTYVYTFRGQKYISGNTIMKTNRTTRINRGDEVTVYIDQNNPKRAIIKHLCI